MKIKGFYGETELPDDKLWVKDSVENRLFFKCKFGEAKYEHPDFAYIEFDMKTKSWKPTFSFQWLYTNQPPLTNIDYFTKNY
jgi:hypothetical protein